MTSISSRLLGGSLWLSFARALVNALSMASMIILAWYLTPADFGIVALGTTFLMIATSATEMSLAEALIRHPAPKESHFNAAWTFNAVRGLVLCLVLCAAAYPLARLQDDPRLATVVAVLGIGVFIAGLGNPRRIMLQRDLIFWQEFMLSVATKLAGVVASITIAVIYQSYWALLVGTLLTQLTNVLLSYVIMPFKPRISFEHMREFFGFGAWLSAGQIVNTLNWRFDYLLIGRVLGNVDLGYYSLGSNLALLPTREATAPLTATIYPGFSHIRDDAPRLAAAYQRIQALVTAVSLPAGIGVAVIAEPLVRLVLAEKWLPIVVIVQGLAAVYAVQTLGALVQPLGMAKGETRRLFIRDTQMLILRVPVIAAGLYFGGLAGVVLARAFTGLTGVWVNMMLVRRFTGIGVGQQLAANLRALVSVACMAVVVLYATRFATATETAPLALEVSALVCLGGAVYCGMSLCLWLLMRRPNGPENEVARLAGMVLGRLRFL